MQLSTVSTISNAARGRAICCVALFMRARSAGVGQQAAHLVDQVRGGIGAERHAVLEQVIRVALFLSRDRVEDHHRNSHRQAFGARQAAALRDDEIAGGHELVHVPGEPHRHDLARPRRRDGSQRLFEFLVPSRQRDELHVVHGVGEHGHGFVHALQAEPAGREEDRRRLRAQAELQPHRPGRELRLREDRHDRDSRHADFRAADPRFLERVRHFVGRDEVPVHAFLDPHRVDVVVGQRHEQRRGQLAFAPERAEDFAGQVVRADDRVGRVPADHADDRRGVQPVNERRKLLRFRRRTSCSSARR